ncbi:hypothetical protein HHI36_023063 [Cryptolaemus montrouzieri]|uniref:Histone deacetylase domain-containing protein n=1 Tax=Cryptolaemus montrouzieri TaxID=559131 RepID=A0ABD2PF71_9CUCU
MPRETARSTKRIPRTNKPSLKAVMALRKKQIEEGALSVSSHSAPDPYELCYKYMNDSRKPTAVGTEIQYMADHKNVWDDAHPENPERLQEVINRIATLSLLTRCEVLPDSGESLEEDVCLVHSPSLLEILKNIENENNVELLEAEAAKYDGIYFCGNTFKAAMKALAWTLKVTIQVCLGTYHNGFAIVRPPGHHAKYNAFEGYCYFNNVAIAAEKCLKENLCKKILIVDFDVHHGNGTQEAFYKRDDVLYFSIHRYENGMFWPNLREGNFDFIGEEAGRGFNVNVPLDNIGMKDTEYFAIIFNILLPMAYEFCPDLVLISAGYDAAVGCPEGQMLVTPGFYCHVVQLLAGLANGHVVMVLEGGYFIPSLTEGAAMSLKGLLNDPCPLLVETSTVHRSVVEAINNCKGALYNHWNCFSVVQRFEYMHGHKLNHYCEHLVSVKYYGDVDKPPYLTRDYYPIISKLAEEDFTSFIMRFRCNEGNYKSFKGTGYAYEPSTLLHVPDKKSHSYENPGRLTKILELMREANVIESLIEVKVPEDRNDLKYCVKVHDATYVDNLINGCLTPFHDLYINDFTAQAAMTAVNVLLTLVDSVQKEEVTNAVALIRPPGHHASIANGQGFCFLNNVAIAAKYAREKYNVTK